MIDHRLSNDGRDLGYKSANQAGAALSDILNAAEVVNQEALAGVVARFILSFEPSGGFKDSNTSTRDIKR